MKRAIVIGATSGIGRGLAECFAAQGYAVGLVGRRENLLKEIAQADPAAYRFAVADVTRPAETVAALERLVRELGGMDLCVVSAGTGDLNPSLDFALEETAILTNVLGWTAVADWAYNRFERQGGGHEQGMVPQALQHGFADLPGQRVVLRQLQVVLGLGRLVAGGRLAVGPFRLLRGSGRLPRR